MSKIKSFLSRIEWSKISVATYVRYILMIITVINTILTRLGYNPISVSETTVYQTVSDIITVVTVIMNTWCNNSVTTEAIAADGYLNDLKSGSTTEE